ncbi:MAG: CopD family protein, partial [Nitrosopumilaceae archaeon]|nr:CopD family protein [Nitrosopumilaceae archaeon]
MQLNSEQLEKQSKSESLFLPEAAARFPGLVGQTIILGSVIASLLIWGTQNKKLISDSLEKLNSRHHGKFLSITGIGLILVFISNIAMLAVQSMRLETSALDAIQTTFGMTWLIRMIITVILLGIWFWIDKSKKMRIVHQISMITVSLALIGTTTMMGHGAASEQFSAIVLDYIHNLVASVWIGGIIYFVFTLLPTLATLDENKRERMSLVMIPRFSIAFIIAVGIVIITGPTLMWFLESDVGLITESTYGKLIFAKIAIATIMVGLGGYFQFKIQRPAEKNITSGQMTVHKKLKKSLKFDAALGILLLGVVALLANGSLPAGEIEKAEAQEATYGFSTSKFSENLRFDLEISPFTSGANNIFIQVSDFENNQVSDLDTMKVKVSNPSRNISPIEVPLERIKSEDKPDEFKGEITFGFSGDWLVEVEAQRTENANESVRLNLLVKPHLENLKIDINEYEFPEKTKPLFPLYDGHDSIWISDPTSPRLWKFDLNKEQFEYFSYNGGFSMFLTIDNQGMVWFTDSGEKQIGSFNPQTKEFKTFPIPELEPTDIDSVITFIQADFDDNIWIAVTNKDTILKFDQKSQNFEELKLENESIPFALAIDNDGMVWFTESAKGRIGY